MKSTVDVELIDSTAFAGLVTAASHVYGAAMHRSPEMVVQRREIMQSHLHRRGFVAVTAVEPQAPDSDRLVGFGYGYQGKAGDWWHDTVAGALGRDAARQWLRDAFELAELHVRPDRHGQGVGRRILDRLLGAAAGDTVVLSTHDRESPARQLYRSVGFVDLVGGFRFPGSAEVYAIMGLDRRSVTT
ncbi:MAG TPA: GNAT family N-acetyltransferase [Mycobacteriales bacterium]|nr:GNAT family N-acetyltransferase [Mycobacteriales bacterium]